MLEFSFLSFWFSMLYGISLVTLVIVGVHLAPKLAEFLARKWLGMIEAPVPDLFYHPMRAGLKPPTYIHNSIIMNTQEDIILPPASSKISSAYQRVKLGYRVEIPHGYVGILSLVPDALLDSQDLANEMVVCATSVLYEGWCGELVIELENRHPTEPAGLPAGNRLANLCLFEINPVNPVVLIKE